MRWNIAALRNVAVAQYRDGAAVVLGWALVFFLLAVVAGYLGFFGLAGIAAAIAKVLFLLFLVVLVVTFLARALRGKSVM
ncbi:MAG: DUF1328 family protein [Hyphomonadaceae bacterium]